MKYYATKISENISETPEGFLICIGVPIGRVGEMEYAAGETPIEPGKDGIVRIKRSPEELFRPETMASFEGKPLTIKHPENFVDPENWKDLAKGTIQNVRRGEGENKDDLIADILITDSFAISLVKSGVRGLSCGYEAEYVETGEGKGFQKDILGNHLALVEEGRAGSAYAINDHKGVFKMSKKLGEKIKSMFVKVVDEAMESEGQPEGGKKSKDAGSYDELVKMFKDLGAKIDAMKPKDDAEEKVEEKDEEKVEEKDADPMAAMEERLKALEMAVEKLMEMEASEAGDDEEESKDDDEEEEVVTDDGPAVAKLTGDEISRVEILAPGLKPKKDAKVAALKVAYTTTDGKKIIDSLTGGKPTFDSKDRVDTLFIAASELMKSSRSKEMTKTKFSTNDFSSSIFDQERYMTPEKMNEINAKKYKI